MEHTYVKAVTSGEADYARGIRSLVRGLWTGELDEFTFIDTMVFAIQRGLRRAWFEGAEKCSIKPVELTKEELDAMNKIISEQYYFLIDFASSISKNSKANRGKLTPLYRRAELWVNQYGEARNQAKLMACGDKKLKWKFNPLKEHCSSCAMLDGRVYRASIWRKYNIRPRMSSLACGGWRCGCEFIITDEAVTPGRPPRV